jgi:ankyrin repeat protein
VRFVIAGRSQDEMLDLVRTLLDAGANPSDGLWPALSTYDKAFDQIEMIALLLERGADPGAQVGNTGNTVRELLKVNARLYSQRVHALFRER